MCHVRAGAAARALSSAVCRRCVPPRRHGLVPRCDVTFPALPPGAHPAPRAPGGSRLGQAFRRHRPAAPCPSVAIAAGHRVPQNRHHLAAPCPSVAIAAKRPITFLRGAIAQQLPVPQSSLPGSSFRDTIAWLLSLQLPSPSSSLSLNCHCLVAPCPSIATTQAHK